MIINTMFVIVMLIFLLFIIIGFCRGLFKSIFKLLAGVLAMALSYFLAPLVSGVLINNTAIDDYIKGIVDAKIESTVENKIEKQVREELEQTLGISAGAIDPKIIDSAVEAAKNVELTRSEQIEMINNISAPDFMKDALIENNYDDIKQTMGVSNFYDYISTYISYMVMNAVAFGMTYVIITLLFILISVALTAAVNLPIVNTINRFGGIVFGAGEALLVVWILFAIISLAATTDAGSNMYAQIVENQFLKTLYDKNVINNVIVGISKVI